MSRTIHLLIYNSPLFPAHWSLWIPSADNPIVGKRLHATGDAASGFEIAFERNYDLGAESRRYQVQLLAEVLSRYVVDVKEDGSLSCDQTPHDYIEQVALSVPAPTRSLVAATSQGPRQRVAIQNCQTWLRAVVVALVEAGTLDDSALRTIDSAPKN